MSLKKLYKKLQTNLMNARIERTTYQEVWNGIERILDWEEFSEVR